MGSGKALMSLRLDVSCWVKLTLLTPSPVLSEATLLFRLDVTSATAQMLWSQPTTKLLSGSNLRNLYLGSQPRRIGFMNRSRICEGKNHQLFNHQWLMY